MSAGQEILFPPFRLDSGNECLWRGSQRITPRRKTFAVLRYLAERPGQLVTKEELLTALWPGVYVTDTVLKVCLREIRAVLGDAVKTPRVVETVHGRGYRFIAAITTTAPLQGSGVGGQGSVREPRNEVARRPEHTVSAPNSGPRTPSPVLVGRESELAQLHCWLDKALQGERQIVFVTGEAGIGKTTLIEVFLKSLESRVQNEEERQKSKGKSQKAKVKIPSPAPSPQPPAPKVWIGRGQCVESYGAGEAYMPLLVVFERLCRGTEGEYLVGILRQYAPLWLAQMPSLIQPTEEGLQHQLMGSTPERMLREIAQAVEALTIERPLVLVLEDLHWSDYSTLAFISFLARRRESARLMIVGTYRPVEVLANDQPLRAVTQELQMHRLCEELPLTLLTEEAVAEYLAVRMDLPSLCQQEGKGENSSSASLPKLARTIHRRTEGNPLFMVTVVDDLLVQGNLDSHVAEIHAPATIRQMIEWQFDRLSSHEQQLLEVASVVGVEFSAASVAVDAEPTVATVEATCAALARRGQFVRASGAVEWPLGTVAARFNFLHALYQAVIYERVTAGRRALLHQQIGERLEAAYGKRAGEIAAELAVHFEEGCDYPRAVHYLKHAGENALRRNAHREATTHFMRGLELLTSLPDTLERVQQELVLQAALGEALMVTKSFAAPEAERAYARARELCQQVGETSQLFPVLSGLRLFHMARAEWRQACELGEQLLRLAQNAQDSALLLGAHHALGDTVSLQGELTHARMHQEQAIALYHPEQHHTLAFGQGYDLGVDALAHGAWVLWYLGYPEQALQRSHAALTLAQKLSHTYSVAHARWCAAWLHQLRREAYATQEQAEATIALATEHGFAGELLWATIHRGWALVEQGHTEKGIDHMHQGLTALRTTGAEVFRPGWLAVLAEAYAKVGQAEKGLGMLAEALALTERNGEHLHEAELYRLAGELSLRMGERETGRTGDEEKIAHSPIHPFAHSSPEECFQKAIEIARHQQAKSLELRATMSLARLWQQQGKITEAHRMLVEIYGWFTEGFDTKDLQEAKVLLVSLASRV